MVLFQEDNKEKLFQRAVNGISDLISRTHYFLELITDFKKMMEEFMLQNTVVISRMRYSFNNIK